MSSKRHKFTLLELLIVIAILGILLTLLLPSLGKAKEKSLFAVCSSNRRQNYTAMMIAIKGNKQKMPLFISKGKPNPETPLISEHDWSGARQRNGRLINPVGEIYAAGFKEIMICRSLENGVFGSGKGSNGGFNYSFPSALSRVSFSKIETEITWNNMEKDTPVVLEESPEFNQNGDSIETSFSASDSIGSWHDFGKKSAYTSVAGHNVVMRPMGVRYSAGNMWIYYEGTNKKMTRPNSLVDNEEE